MNIPLINYLALEQIPVRLRDTHPALGCSRWLQSWWSRLDR